MEKVECIVVVRIVRFPEINFTWILKDFWGKGYRNNGWKKTGLSSTSIREINT